MTGVESGSAADMVVMRVASILAAPSSQDCRATDVPSPAARKEPSLKDVTTPLARDWWILLIRGIAAVLFGLAAFAWPGLTIEFLVLAFGILLLLDGVSTLVQALRNREASADRWLWLLEGALGTVLGALILLMPGIATLYLVVLVAAWSILGGAVRIAVAIRMRRKIEGAGLLGASGVLSILLAVAIIALPYAGLVSIAWIIGFWAIALGTLFMLAALRLRRELH